MKIHLDKFYAFLSQPLFPMGRVLLGLAVVPLLLSFTAPLWRISMEAAQYPKGLYMDIYSYKLDGGNEGQDIKEINTLNHYIGMAPIDRASLADLDWIPFALGFLAIFTLRVAVIGTVRDLIDAAVLTAYVSAFAFARFAYALYTFGHNLADDAPVTVEPFMPALFGTKVIANFTTHSFPKLGSYLMGAFAILVMGTLVWHLIAGRRRAVRELSAPAV